MGCDGSQSEAEIGKVVDLLTDYPHLRIEIEVKDGAVVDAYSSGTMVRGFEIILKGRDPRDAWAFTERICGVCTGTHALTSVRAVGPNRAWLAASAGPR